MKRLLFGHTLSKIFKKSLWWDLGTQIYGPKDMEDPVVSVNTMVGFRYAGMTQQDSFLSYAIKRIDI